MKTLVKKTFFIVLMAVAVSSATLASTPRDKIEKTITLSSEEQGLIKRLEEINSMDFKLLSRNEKREMRHEKAALREEIRTRRGGGGIYISAGAIIVILLIIIIL